GMAVQLRRNRDLEPGVGETAAETACAAEQVDCRALYGRWSRGADARRSRLAVHRRAAVWLSGRRRTKRYEDAAAAAGFCTAHRAAVVNQVDMKLATKGGGHGLLE